MTVWAVWFFSIEHDCQYTHHRAPFMDGGGGNDDDECGWLTRAHSLFSITGKKKFIRQYPPRASYSGKRNYCFLHVTLTLAPSSIISGIRLLLNVLEANKIDVIGSASVAKFHSPQPKTAQRPVTTRLTTFPNWNGFYDVIPVVLNGFMDSQMMALQRWWWHCWMGTRNNTLMCA